MPIAHLTCWTVDEVSEGSGTAPKVEAWTDAGFTSPIMAAPDMHGNDLAREAAMMEQQDPISFKVEMRSQFVDGRYMYFQPDMVSRIFQPYHGQQLTMRRIASPQWTYRMHADAGLVNDYFAAMVAHSEPGEQGQHLVVDWYNVWRPEDYPDHTIPYRQVLAELQSLVVSFRLASFSMDSWNSELFLREIEATAQQHQLDTTVSILDSNHENQTRMMEQLKKMMIENRVHSPIDDLNRRETNRCLLEAMLDRVELVDGKITKPRVPGFGHLDLVDCVMALADAIKADETQERTPQYSMGTTATYNPMNIIPGQAALMNSGLGEQHPIPRLGGGL